MIVSDKTTRSVQQQGKNTGSDRPSLYGVSGTVVYGSESNSNFIDVLSVGPISSIDNLYINETDSQSGEFPLSKFYTHTGELAAKPFDGDFPYVERSYNLTKKADITEKGKGEYTNTTFTRSVSGKGVSGVRIIFNSPQFTHKDNKNRRKKAEARFKIHLLDENGVRVKTEITRHNQYYSNNPVSVQLTIMAREQDRMRTWDYEVEMDVMVSLYGTVVSGGWTANIVTELYLDTQSYKDIAMVSGRVVADDVSGGVPTREYLIKGYKVDVPNYTNGIFDGSFKKETSNSHAWNSMAVLVDEKWGAGLPIDKINITDFIDFDNYITEIMPDGSPRYSHSQQLVKADNFYRIASQMVGAADGKLYEDTSGRIGVIIDKQTSKRRIITSYDLKDEKVKRTTVPEKKKTNYVEISFKDKTNNYQTNIISTQDDEAITKNGLIKENLKSDTCTSPLEAQRTINKVLVTSQVAVTSYVFTVGHTHEDIKIGEVVALYDRIYSRRDYCGKVTEGSTVSRIEVDKRTPIDIEGITTPFLVLDNGRDLPTRSKITSWANGYIVLETPLSEVPEPFTSFGIESDDISGLKPTLVKVLGVTDTAGVLQIEGVDYNDSIYSHVENGTSLVTPITRIIPKLQEEIVNLTVTKITDGISSNWDDATSGSYIYFWKKFTGDLDRDPNGTGILVTSGQTSISQNTLPIPLEPARYEFSVYILDENTGQSSSVTSISISLGLNEAGSSSISPATNFDTDIGLGKYEGQTFKLKWNQIANEISPYLAGYTLRITQNGSTLEANLPNTSRSYQVSTQALVDTFGENYGREFVARLIPYDDTLESSPTQTRIVNNDPPQAPDITVSVTGNVTLSTLGEIPTDTIGSIIYVWEGLDINEVRPLDAYKLESGQITEVLLPNNTLVYDNRDYIFEAAWVDTFGKEGLVSQRAQVAYGPDVLVPTPLELIRANAFSITGIQVEFEHDGVWLEKMKVYYRKTNEDGTFTLDNTYLFTGGIRVTYDAGTQLGTFIIEDLDYNGEYEIFATVSNVSSADSESSNTVIGNTIPYANVEDIREDINDILDNIIDVRDEIDGTIKPLLSIESLKRESSDKELFNTTAALVEFRKNSNSEINTLRDATFEVDPSTGTIGLRAFNYADNQFTQAGLLIDGVDSRVSINAGSITDLGESIASANSSIDVLAGQIVLKSSYTEMTEYVNGAIDAVLPVYSFGFFNGTEGWAAVNGTITQGGGFITTIWGDIQNTTLNYIADENPIITLTYKRTGGTGNKGDLLVTYEGGSQLTYAGVINQSSIGDSLTQNLNLSEDTSYTGTITGIHIILGESSSDSFEINNITIGKPSSQLEALDSITAQVNQAGIDIDAIEGQLSSFVTSTFYNDNTVTLNNVSQVLDGESAIISLKASQQELVDNNTVSKATDASIWINGADASIRTGVINFNSEAGSVDDQISGLSGSLNTVTEELSTIDGAKIRTNLISIDSLATKSKDLEEIQFYTELKLLDQRNDNLAVGESVATIDTQYKSISNDQGALSQEITLMKASTGLLEGQINANVTRISQTETSIDGTAKALAGLTTDVKNTQGDLSDAQLALTSTIDELGNVSSRAYLGASNTIGGKTVVTGITADSSTNGLRFQGDIIQFDDTSGNPALQYRSDFNKWEFSGRLSAPEIDGGTITGNTITGSTINGNTINGGTINATTLNGGTINSTTVSSSTINAATLHGGIINSATLNGVDGTFTGVVYAENIEGDVIDSLDTQLDSLNRWDVTTSGQRLTLTSFTIKSAPFARMVKVSDYSAEIQLRNGVVGFALVVGNVSQGELFYRTSSPYIHTYHFPSAFDYIPAYTEREYTLQLRISDQGSGGYIKPAGKNIVIQVYKRGSSIIS